MKRHIKYPLTVLFALLMGYSQVFAFLGPLSGVQSHKSVQQRPAANSAFESAVFGEVEEDEDERSSFTEGFTPAILVCYSVEQVPTPVQRISYRLSLPRTEDSYLRLRVIRL